MEYLPPFPLSSFPQHLWNAETVGRFRFLLRMNRIVSALLAAGRRSIGDLNGDKSVVRPLRNLGHKKRFFAAKWTAEKTVRMDSHRAALIPK